MISDLEAAMREAREFIADELDNRRSFMPLSSMHGELPSEPIGNEDVDRYVVPVVQLLARIDAALSAASGDASEDKSEYHTVFKTEDGPFDISNFGPAPSEAPNVEDDLSQDETRRSSLQGGARRGHLGRATESEATDDERH